MGESQGGGVTGGSHGDQGDQGAVEWLLTQGIHRYERVFFSPRLKKHSGPKGASVFSPTRHQKLLVFFSPGPTDRLPFRYIIQGNTSKQRVSFNPGPKSASAGLAAGRPATMKKWGWFFSPTLIFDISGSRKTMVE